MSQFNTQQYDIERPTGHCAFSSRQLQPGESYYATLVELTPEEMEQLAKTDKTKSALGLKRLDVSAEIWDAGNRPNNLFGYWKTVVPEPNAKKRQFVDDTVLMDMLKKLALTDDADKLAFRYVLALILMRKRLLRYDSSTKQEMEFEDGTTELQEVWTLTPKLNVKKGPMSKWDEDSKLELFDPKLDAEKIEQVTIQLGDILNADF
ncbi:hypothetical protein KS4_11550 [Poriferisphaera corsica]|uniref:Uncharacterized protein n=1 Tax=Poriferisphaera corsica TaxID=2528020 RepID=A0A517YSB1_9BACT|nr:hypothetical protein [Poriferisphaera corsica]QDU33113.1 hypothetical protein KS4_11550 [Poriferisphaera corsica]